MNLLRWNNGQRPQGKSVEPSASHSGQVLEVKKRFSLPVEGEVFSLTFPFIDPLYRPGHNAQNPSISGIDSMTMSAPMLEQNIKRHQRARVLSQAFLNRTLTV